MPSVLENLERLNRKERFYLIGAALGNQSFRLASEFRQELSREFALTVPENAFVAMDYHLNWIYTACALAFEQPIQKRIYPNASGIVDGTQEDVDLVIAWQDTPSNIFPVVMLEAKGATPYSNAQFRHKVNRLCQVFGDDGKRWPHVTPYLGLMSPRPPKRLDYSVCPSWMKIGGKIPWLRMPIPTDRLVLFGCDNQGKPNQDRPFWTVRG